MNKYIFITFFIFYFLFFSCRKDIPVSKDEPAVIIKNDNGVYITNEGNFQFGNAKVSYYDIANEIVIEDIFQQINNRPLGDVCQSLCVFNDKIYIVVNNSGKIEVVDKKNFKSTGTISNLKSPRYFLPVSNNKAYVTDLYANAISIVDLNTNIKIGDIPCSGWTEELVLSYGKAFVTNMFRDKIYIVNTATDIIEDSIQVGYASNSLREDKNGMIWVLCSGSYQKNRPSSLHKINPITKKVELTMIFNDNSDNPFKLNINFTKDTLYYINNGIFRLPITSTSIPSSPFIDKGNSNFYAVGIEPYTGIIYIADAIDYIQRGVIYRYKPDGTLINSFKAGIIPGNFYFY
jgi:DNA-binding beta-propeller fold protein YncE